MSPLEQAFFCARGKSLTIMVEVYYGMLQTKYQGSMPFFRQEDFFMISVYKKNSEYDQVMQAYVKHVTPVSFLALGHTMNTLGRGPLNDATYQISWL